METTHEIREETAELVAELDRAYTEISDNRYQILEIIALITGKKHFAARQGGQTALTTREAIDFIHKSFTVLQKECQDLRKTVKREQTTKERVSQIDLFRP